MYFLLGIHSLRFEFIDQILQHFLWDNRLDNFLYDSVRLVNGSLGYAEQQARLAPDLFKRRKLLFIDLFSALVPRLWISTINISINASVSCWRQRQQKHSHHAVTDR